MKQKFSTKWKASKQPRKQRKYLANAPLHLRKKFLSVNLSKELRKKQKKRNIVVRKGDTVKVMRGKFKKKQGKVLSVDLKKIKLTIEGIQIKKQDGSKINVKMRPSNLQIVELGERGKVKQKVAPLGVPQNKELGGKKKPETKGVKKVAPLGVPPSTELRGKVKKAESKTKPMDKKE
jgi:large subunit ribosomal protein L24